MLSEICRTLSVRVSEICPVLSTNAVRNLSETASVNTLWDPIPATERGMGPVLSEKCPILSTDSPPLIGDLSEIGSAGVSA